MKKRILSMMLLTVLLLVAITPTKVNAATKYSGWDVADDNGVICTGEFDSLTYGYLIFFPAEMLENDQVYPVISWANGTMCAPGFYYELLSQIAAGGYIVITNTDMMAADGTSQIGSIDFILEENANPESRFYGRVDVDNIGVAGHSQGGRSAVNAAVADKRIKCVMSIAGSNFKEEAEKLTTPVFFTTGTSDMVVLSSMWVKPAYNYSKGMAVYASLNGALHTACCTNPEKYSGYAISWFDAWLKNSADAMNIFLPDGALSRDSNWKNYESKNY